MNARRWPVSRVVWTLVAVGVVWLASHITLPGINRAELAHVINKSGSHWNAFAALAQLSLLALGITPLVNAFLLVEVVALIVPRWRPLRHGGPEGRRVLGRATAAVAIVLATIQAYFVVRYLESLEYTGLDIYYGSRWVTVATLVAGTMVTAWLVSVIDVRGIGNGYAVLLLLGMVSSVHWMEPAPTMVTGSIAVAAALLVVVITALLVGSRPRAIPLPASGAIPLADARALGALFATLSMFGIWSSMLPKIADAFEGRGLGALAVIAFTVLWAYVFARPSLSGTNRADWWGATWVTMLALLAALAATTLAREFVPEAGHLLDPWKLMLITAIALDLVEELRARRVTLIPVWPLHAPLRVHEASARLTAAGIEHHVRSRRLRSLLWFFGPYVPMMVLVPPDRAPDAERILREL
jgi:hypothetical protein